MTAPNTTAGDGISVLIGANIAGLLSGMKESSSAVRAAGAEMKGALEGVETVAKNLLAPFIAIMAICKGGSLLGDAVHSTMELGSQLTKLSEKTGVSVSDLSRLQFAAHMVDVSAEELTGGLVKLARSMGDAAKGGPTAQAFQRIGVAVKDANGELRPMRDVLLDVAQRFEHMPNGAEKSATAMELFGRAGTTLIPILNQGRDGIAALGEEADKLGITMSTEDVKAAQAYEEAIKTLHATWDGFIKNIVIAVMPVLVKLMQTLQALVHVVIAVGTAIAAAAHILTGNFAAAAEAGREAVEELKKAWESFNPSKPLSSTGATGDTPDFAPKDTVTHMDRLQHELDEIKLAHADAGEFLVTLELEFWRKKIKAEQEGSKDYLDIYSKIADLTVQDTKNSADRIKKNIEEMQRAQKAIADDWMAVFRAIPNAWSQTIEGMKERGGSFRDFMRGLTRNLVGDFIAAEVRMVAAHAAAWLARKGITTQGVAATVALESWAALKVVTMKAAEAAAGAYAALAGVPYVGPFIAPAAAAAALAAVLALTGSLHSAAGGYDIPGNVNPITQLHAQEMVLPAKYANVIRQMGEQGRGGDRVVVNISAMDASSVQRWAMKNKDLLADAAIAAAHGGRATRMQPGRRA